MDRQRTIIICVLGGVSYPEIRAAAEIERRTGCRILIGGTEVLTPASYLDRMSMEGEWTTIPDDPEPPKYNPKEDAAAAAAAAAEGQPTGLLDRLMARVPSSVMRTLCCDDEEEINRPRYAGQSGGAAGGEGSAAGDEALVPQLRP